MDVFEVLPDTLSLRYQLKQIDLSDTICPIALELITVASTTESTISMTARHVTDIDHHGHMHDYVNRLNATIFIAKNGRYEANIVLIKRLIGADATIFELVKKRSYTKSYCKLEYAIDNISVETVNEFFDPGNLTATLLKLYGK